jgi:hypothetical protein
MSTLVKSAAEILADLAERGADREPDAFAGAEFAPHEPDLLTPEQVMRLLGWTRHRLRQARLPCTRTLGGHRRYRLADVQTYHQTAQG